MNTPRPCEPSARSLRWLSEDYSALREAAQGGEVIDVLVVGSGYGGAMAALEFAGLQSGGKPVQVCVLERGKEYAPGMFPSSLQELPGHVRVHRSEGNKTMGRLEGLLDVRLGPHVCTILGNGLGGGSLINAGVMIEPKPGDTGLPPQVLRDLAPQPDGGGFFEHARRALLPEAGLQAQHPDTRRHELLKTRALQAVRPLQFRHAPITVQTREGDADVPRCTLCGDCMTGCNVGAKRSLDTTLLARAKAKGARIYTGGSVIQVRPGNGGEWLVQTVFTNQSLKERHAPVELRARKVVLAAGTLGSTEILLRSRSDALRLSHRLGERFSCNGDNLVAVHDGPAPVRAAADEWKPLRNPPGSAFTGRRVGPTITGIVDLGEVLLQEFAVPGPLKRLFDEIVTTSSLLHRLTRFPGRTASQERAGLDTMAVDPRAMNRTLLVGLIGHDEALGRLLLPRQANGKARPAEGQLRIEWPEIRTSPRLERAFALAREALGGDNAAVLANPLWRLLPEDTEFLVRGERGPVLTVHPLGGCAMGSSHLDGVVDDLGRVFRPDAADPQKVEVHPGLVVLDGSIIPGSLGANPALTITAVAARAAQKLAVQWGWTPAAAGPLQALRPRPVYRTPEQCTPPRPVPTEVELVERLAGAAGERWVELTLFYAPVKVADIATLAARTFRVDPGRSRLRVYDPLPPLADGRPQDFATALMHLKDHERDALATYHSSVDGTLTLSEPQRGELATSWHALRTAGAWFMNRGTRELWDRFVRRLQPRAKMSLGGFFRSAARAGEARVFDYRLDASRPAAAGGAPVALRLRGRKQLTYGRRANPWRQLTRMELEPFDGLPRSVLALDARFIAGQGVPLLRITRQQNQVVALAEFASLGAAWARMLVSIHLWSFRAPDPPPPRRPDLLPGAVARLPQPQVLELDLEAPEDRPVRVRLTRYERRGGPPIALIHGYSASGNTFTHPAVPQPLARHLWERGHDVWVLDLRTSAGMKTARLPWRFEDAALADIPVAIEYIAQRTGARVDVFAHCIGAVMLSMGLLADQQNLGRYDRKDLWHKERAPRRYPLALAALKDNLHRIVLSQKGPMLVYCDDNVLRAYFMRLLRRAILPDDYQFRVKPDGGVSTNLMDRLLATLPYPEEEFDRENPWWPSKRTPWAGFRHRMDALYARDFTLANIADETLDAIEDLFGPLNLETVAQAIHFARQNTITDGTGRPFDTSSAALAQAWPRFGTLSIHGSENGLVHAKTLEAMQAQMHRAGIPYEARLLEGFGHQDCLIGIEAGSKVFPVVSEFLESKHGSSLATALGASPARAGGVVGPISTRPGPGPGPAPAPGTGPRPDAPDPGVEPRLPGP